MKQELKNLLISLPGFESICRILTRKHVRTLMYHRFSESECTESRSLSAATLRKHLDYITRHHPCWLPSDHWDALNGQKKWLSCPVVITIDDGYRDFYRFAFPVLRDAGVPAMLFVTTAFVDGSKLLWWDRLAQMLEKSVESSVSIMLGTKLLQIDLSTSDSRYNAWNTIADRCRFLSEEEKISLMLQLESLLHVGPADIHDERYQAVTWDEVRVMHASNIQFGAHTVNHPILSRLALEQASYEIKESKKRIVEEVGDAVDWFCYPQGGPADFTSEVKNLIKEASFKGSYIAYQDIDSENDFVALPRYCAPREILDLRWCLCGAEYIVLRIRKLIGRPARLGEDYWIDHDE